MSLKNCLPCVATLPANVVKRLNYLDKGRLKRKLKMKTFNHNINQKTLIFSADLPGAITTIYLELESKNESITLNSNIEIFVDDELTPSIVSSIKNFFLSCDNGKLIVSNFHGKTLNEKDGAKVAFYRYLFIPYNKNIRVYLSGSSELYNVNINIYYYEGNESLNYGRFGKAYTANYKGTETIHGRSIELMKIKGKGAIHSINFTTHNKDTRGSFLEGNFEIYIDGNPFPRYQSTGTEEFFMGGIYFMNLHESYYSGCARSFNDGSDNSLNYSSAHRLFIEDPILFDQEFKIIWHNGEIGQGGPYAGTTEFDFQAIYYLEQDVISTEEIPLVQGLERLFLLDNNVYNQHTIIHDIPKKVISKKNKVLYRTYGAGSLGYLFIESNNDLCNSKIGFIIDDVDLGSIPTPLFFLNDINNPYHTGEYAGRTGVGTFYKYVNIPYKNYCEIYIDSDEVLNISGSVHIFKSIDNDASLYIHKTFSNNFINITGKGKLESLVLTSNKEIDLDQRITIIIDNDTTIETNFYNFFFLNPTTTITGCSTNIGVLNNHEVITFYRYFIEDAIIFNQELRIILNNFTGFGYITCHLINQHNIYQSNYHDFLTRLNILDKAYDANYAYCYNPIEDERGSINANETKILFEDFGSGYINCIRLGTPQAGKELSDAKLRIYLNGNTKPAVDTTVARFFSAYFTDAIYYNNSKRLARISKLNSNKPIGGGHTSFFRYLCIPYQQGIKITLTAPHYGGLRGFMNVYYNKSKEVLIDYGRYNQISDLTYAGKLMSNNPTLIGEKTGTGMIVSIQFRVEGEIDDCFLDEEILIYVDNQFEPSIKTKIAKLFFGSRSNHPYHYMDVYTETWKNKRIQDNGHYTSVDVGWPLRTDNTITVYRFFDKTPIIFNESLKIFITSKNTYTLYSDIIVYTTN